MSSRNQGIIFIVLSAVCFSFMNALVRLAGDIPSIQKSFFRNFMAIFFAIIIILKNKDSFKFKKENFKLLIARSFFGTIGVLCNFYTLDKLLLSDSSMLNKLSPFSSVIFSFILLKEKVKPWQIIAIIIAFFGSLFIIKPSLNLNFIPSALGVFGSISAGLAYTLVRVISLRGEKSSIIILFFSTFSCLVTLPYVIFNYTPMTLTQFLYLMSAGIFAGLGQFAITIAYSKAPAKEISVFDYSQIIFTAILGFFLFDQIPDKYSILGYIIIFSVAIFMFFANSKLEKEN